MSGGILRERGRRELTILLFRSLRDVPFIPVASYKDPVSVVKQYASA